jgi:phosphomannomutase
MLMVKESENLLENELFKSVYDKTPEYVKNLDLMNFDNKGEFCFTLKKTHLYPYDAINNPEGLNLLDWFEGYAKEAKVSTAGIRGPQNILYPQDTRFPINLVGIVLATLAKALVARDKYKDKKIVKIAGCEVRYNSKLFLDAIARIQAANGITTLVPAEKQTIPIWMASFLAFKLDLLGGEYITSSHGISVKNATKDLNCQGSQYLPEESMEFVNKIQEIFDYVEKNGSYDIKIAAVDNPLINESVMKSLDDGVDLYVEYLKSGVAKDVNLDLIKSFSSKIAIENVGGSAYRTLSRVLKKLNIADKFVWFNTEEDPFFHSIGKYDTTPKGEKAFYDYSVDATVLAKKQDGSVFFPVIDTLNYSEKLSGYPVGTVVLITDPDHDRLTITQTEPADRIPELSKLGIDYVKLSDDKILSVFTANQAFLLLMDFWAKQLKSQNLWNNHPRFMIKTTASALSWDEWGAKNGVKVVNVPVGFKEIANIMKKVELQLKKYPEKEVIVDDVFGNPVNLGVNPRLLFGGEESGGMIMGTEELIKSQHGRFAVAMREKSATEAIIVASALISKLGDKYISEYLKEVFNENNIIGRFDTRVDIAYYNESEPDIEKLKQSKIEGEAMRTKNDMFYLSMAIAMRKGCLSLDQIKSILNDKFNSQGLTFDNLKSVKFVGDGTYLEFEDKYIEIRPSGTDAKTKAYGGGLDKADINKYANILGNYSGDRTELHRNLISDDLYSNCKDYAMEYYLAFVEKDANNEPFEIPEYLF